MTMKIARITTHTLDIPFTFGGPDGGFGPKVWKQLTTLLVRVETDCGLVGWGEAFAYSCADAVRHAVEDLVAPALLGHDAADIEGASRHCQQSLHLFGRYGITMFAISGVDLALWDVAGKAAGQPVHRLLGGPGRLCIPAYSSLFRYGNPDLVGTYCERSTSDGYTAVKLHETTVPAVRAAREALGDGVPLMVDTNCPWTPTEALAMARQFKPLDIHWLEEPVFPPEDHLALARVRRDSGVALAAGENHCTAFQFRDMLAAGAVDFVQPSVTKVGGITEFRKVATLADTSATQLMPHSPYFGPGWLATLHLLAALPESGWIERFYVDVEASTSGTYITPTPDGFRVPVEPGLGPDPDPAVIRAFERQR
ncbi:MAG: mandelate racemase/muconate lactonizing enzyme family protein [Pseudomonadota bacterium]